MAPKLHIKRRRALTIAECLVTVALFGMVMGGAATLISAMWKARAPEYITESVSGETFASCPSQPSMFKAIRLNAALADILENASEIYIFGGYGQLSSDTGMTVSSQTTTFAPGALDALLGTQLTDIPENIRMDPLHVGAFLAGKGYATSANGNDYTLMALAADGTVKAILEVRTTTQADSDRSPWSIWRASLKSVGTDNTTTTLTYGAAMREKFVAFAESPHAVTAWRGPQGGDGTTRFNAPVYRFVLPDPSLESGATENPRPFFNHVYSGSGSRF